MATQRNSIAKVGGLAADAVLQRLGDWSAARRVIDPHEWSSDQWPTPVRQHVDAFARRLQAHALSPPVLHFVEWTDLWSMGDLFARWLTPPGGAPPLTVLADRFEIYGYALPDGGSLARHLAGAGPQQFEESDHFVRRLGEAVAAWETLTDRAAIVVLREVVGGLVTDEEIEASLSVVPDWISEC